jgi:3-hydroxyisobutyrate dehydrogenase-like beta-hydroxyacid dehydrogenase
MGAGAVLRLLDHGHRVVVWNRTAEKGGAWKSGLV